MKTQEAMCLNLAKQNLPGHRQSRTVAVETFVPSGTFSQFFPSLMGTFWLTQSVTWMINEDDQHWSKRSAISSVLLATYQHLVVAEKMNLNILVLVISVETDDSGKDADTKSTIFW